MLDFGHPHDVFRGIDSKANGKILDKRQPIGSLARLTLDQWIARKSSIQCLDSPGDSVLSGQIDGNHNVGQTVQCPIRPDDDEHQAPLRSWRSLSITSSAVYQRTFGSFSRRSNSSSVMPNSG